MTMIRRIMICALLTANFVCAYAGIVSSSESFVFVPSNCVLVSNKSNPCHFVACQEIVASDSSTFFPFIPEGGVLSSGSSEVFSFYPSGTVVSSSSSKASPYCVANVGEFFNKDLTEFGLEFPNSASKYTAVAFGLPKGLALRLTQDKDTKRWSGSISGVPTEPIEVVKSCVFVKVTETFGSAKSERIYPILLDVIVNPDYIHEVKSNVEIAMPSNVTAVTGLPVGLKYVLKPVVSNGVVIHSENTVYGVPSKPGLYNVVITSKVGVNTITKQVFWMITDSLNIGTLASVDWSINNRTVSSIPGVDVCYSLSPPSGATISISGLPSGLKFDAKKMSVSGSPTKPGMSVIQIKTVLNGATLVEQIVYEVLPYPMLSVDVDPVRGTVTGAGGYSANKNITLKAKPIKGYVFAGWYLDADYTRPLAVVNGDYRNATLQYKTKDFDEKIYAKFVTVADDILSLNDDSILIDGIQEKCNAVIDSTTNVSFRVAVASESLPKVVISSLPPGLKFDVKSNVISGRATRPGIYDVVIKSTNVSQLSNPVIKVFRIKVSNLVDAEIPVADMYGPFIPGVVYTNVLAEAHDCSVSGLPTGLKWNAKDVLDKKTSQVILRANSVYGAATKPGFYTVTFTKTINKVKYSSTAIFEVSEFPKLSVDCNIPEGGIIVGAGAGLANRRVTIRATAKNDFAFAGWYLNRDLSEKICFEGDDYRNPTLSYITKASNETIYAKFVPSSEDKLITAHIDSKHLNSNAHESVFFTDGDFARNLLIDSHSLPRVTITGLPTGLKFNSKTFAFSGRIAKPGVYDVVMSIGNASISNGHEMRFAFRIVVDNLVAANEKFDSQIENSRGQTYCVQVGSFDTSILPSLSLASLASTLSVSGLPAGLKYNSATSKIEGLATKSGFYTVYLTVVENGVVSVSTITIEVANSPDFVSKSFVGPTFDDSGTNMCGVTSFKSSATGKISGVLSADGVVWSLVGNGFDFITKSNAVATLVASCGAKKGVAVVDFCDDGCAYGVLDIDNDDLIDYEFDVCCDILSNAVEANAFKNKFNEYFGRSLPSTTLRTTDLHILETKESIFLTLSSAGVITARGTFEDLFGNAYVVSTSTTLLNPEVVNDAIIGEVVLSFPAKAGKFRGVHVITDVTFQR